MREQRFEVVVIGGGPAGVAAASVAARGGRSVALIDDNPALGGQIWRQGAAPAPVPAAGKWIQHLADHGVEIHSSTTVIDAPQPGTVIATDSEGPKRLSHERLILATGAVERFLPFPGWTLPGVVGAGGLQAWIKNGLDVRGKRIVIAGSGPLLLAVADLARRRGARLMCLAEQADRSSAMAFGRQMLTRPSKLFQGLGFTRSLLGVPYRFGTWPRAAIGDRQVERVVLEDASGQIQEISCDLLACGFGLRPNAALAAALGCAVADGRVVVDERQQTTVDGVYCAGESTGIGGVDVALLQGRIAGAAAAGRADEVRKLQGRRRRAVRFVEALDRAFALRPELRQLPGNDTVVCRCEDVSWGRIQPFDDVRDCKLKTRCGMGPCQGRVCGGALEFLKGFRAEICRPPFFPVTLETLSTNTDSLNLTLQSAAQSASKDES